MIPWERERKKEIKSSKRRREYKSWVIEKVTLSKTINNAWLDTEYLFLFLFVRNYENNKYC